ncbi:DUF4214 domain-containing protein [Devosia sp. FJ2-5-3]|uniref:DUF4214 domain-containing protein n=1 Tax=Devosia sp. FJ2-5-3 TaxID=2976680 RepID=UPI0023D7F9B8|nr:DUF4214 domain-containing protein [Devosia sp. FJ2-5-3]WEJ58127.1 DUF4214 domain-containing protein [Devosia sp. FJ2-5-3]
MASIQGVYVALFGRPADPIGLAFFNTATNNGANLTAIGDLASTAEYKERFKDKNNTEIVNSIYKSLFNRDAEEGGLNFFVNALNTGALNINNIAIAILDGAQGSDKTIVDFKIDAAARFTASLDTPTKVAAYSGTAAITAANTFINGVTEKQTDTQIKNAVESVANGLEVLLTAAPEAANSDAAGTLKTSVFNDTINATTADFWNNGDKIDAGVGTDTLNATLATGVTVDGSTTILKNVEVLNLTADGAAVVVNLDKAEGVTTVWSKASANDLTVTNVAKTVAFGVEGVNAAVAFDVKDVAGTADALTITLKGATTAGLTAAGIEKLTLNAETASVSVAGIGGSTLVDAVVSGVGGGTYAFAASATLKTVDAAALTGAGAAIDVSLATKGVTVTGSKFADTITLAAAGADDKDVIVYNSSNISTLTQKDTITNFTSGEDKIDLKAFGFATGATAAITTFGTTPIEGSAFLGNAVGTDGTTLFVDTNKDGVFNVATDLQVDLTGVAITDFIFA